MKRVVIILMFLGTLVSLEAQDSLVFREAEKHFNSGRIQLALDSYDELIKEYPLSRYRSNAYYGSALCKLRLGRSEEAIKGFIDYLDRYREIPKDSHFWLGLAYYQKEEYEESVLQLTEYRKDKSLNYAQEALRTRGKAYFYLSEYELSYQDLSLLIQNEKDLSLYPSETVFLFSLMLKREEYEELIALYQAGNKDLLGAEGDRLKLYASEALWKMGKTEEAKTYLEDLLETTGEVAAVSYQRYFIIAQEEGGDLKQLIRQAERSLAQMPNVLKEFWLRVAIESFEKGEIETAEGYLWRIWDLRDTEDISGAVPLYLSTILQERGELVRSLSVISEYLDKYEDKKELLLFKQGSLYIQQENWEEASEVLSLLMKDYPESVFSDRAQYLKAFSLYRTGEISEAKAELDDLVSGGISGTLEANVLPLMARLQAGEGNQKGQLESLKRYLSLNPLDTDAFLERIKLSFELQDFIVVYSEGTKYLKSYSNQTNPEQVNEINYFIGLSALQLKEYDRAIRHLGAVLSEIQINGPQADLIPYILFYKGWAYYRTPDYGKAIADFQKVYVDYSSHELATRSRYLTGWCAFNSGRNALAEEIFRYLSKAAPSGKELERQSLHLLGKVLVNRDKKQEALLVFEEFLEGPGNPELHQEVAFEAAFLLKDLGSLDASIAMLKKSFSLKPGSRIAQEASFKIGEFYYRVKEWEEARDAFYNYRVKFPKGDFMAAALYWGALSSEQVGEPFGALLLYEELSENYPDSSYRADGLYRGAEIYAAEGDFSTSLRLYGELISLYPQVARSIGAETRAEEIRLLLLGLSDKEAELSVVIGKEGGAKSEEGRKAMVELSRIYIYESRGKQGLALKMLEDVIAKKAVDPYWAARAQFLMGEYYAREEDPLEAGREYLKAVSINPSDKDLTSMCLYKAVEMSLLAGKNKDAAMLLSRLESFFPDSVWTNKAKELMEAR